MAQLEKNTRLNIFQYQRGWGFELVLYNDAEYCGKILHVDEGKRGSLHFHVEKLETMYLVSGKVDLKFIDPETGKPYVVSLDPGDSITIPPGQVHQIIGVKESEIAEYSTEHHEDDSYRVEKGD